MNNLARMAQQLQADAARVEQELQDLRVEGTAGGGVVKATVSGKQEMVSIDIDRAVVDPEDVEMLQDLIVAAVSEAQARARAASEEKMRRVTGGLSIPGLGM